MNKDKRKIISLVAAFMMIFFGVVGVTIAYYQTNDTFTNEFEAGKYKIKTEEVFESPSNWQPGDVTEKKVNVTNEGTIDAAVKVCFRQKWEDASGNPLPLANKVLLNFSNGFSNHWLKDCDNDDVDKYCFYYNKKLEPGETTENLLESVMFDDWVSYATTTTCTEDPTTHTKSCTQEVDGYSGGKYTLYVDIETVQYNNYQSVWSNVQVYDTYDDITSNYCKNLDIKGIFPNRTGRVGYLLHKGDYIDIKESELSNYDLSMSTCRIIFYDSVSEENKYYHCSNAIYLDDNTYNEGDTVNLQSISYQYIYSWDSVTQLDDGSFLITNTRFRNHNSSFIAYGSSESNLAGFITKEDDGEVMFDSVSLQQEWSNRQRVFLDNYFSMPNHSVLLIDTEEDPNVE